MKTLPPTPELSKSPSLEDGEIEEGEYPEYPWLPNAHRDTRSQILHTRPLNTNNYARMSELRHPANHTPDGSTSSDSLRFSFKREASPNECTSLGNLAVMQQVHGADNSLGPATESSRLHGLLADSADDELDDEDELNDEDDLDEEAEEAEEESPVIDRICTAVNPCVAQSGDHRKVVSHIFGRNKICTSQIPPECWVYYCRKHYQRHRFRAKQTGWKRTQFDVIKRQLARMNTWGGVIDWEIALRKKERDGLAAANSEAVQHGTPVKYRESFLTAHLGSGKSFQDVHAVLQVIENEINTTGADDLPGFELLPNIDKRTHPPLKSCKIRKAPQSKREPRKPKTNSKRAAPTDANTSTADAQQPPPKRRRLVRASRISSSPELSNDSIEQDFPVRPSSPRFRAVNDLLHNEASYQPPRRQHRLPDRTVRGKTEARVQGWGQENKERYGIEEEEDGYNDEENDNDAGDEESFA